MTGRAQRVQLCEDQESYFRLMEDAKFERFWDIIQHHSFPAIFVPLPPLAAQWLADAHNQFLSHPETGAPFSLARHAGLSELCARLNIEAQRRAWINDDGVQGGVFVRLSTRSPKDSVMLRPALAEALRAEFDTLREIEKADAATTTESTVLHALYRAAVAANRCMSAEAAIQVLISFSQNSKPLSFLCSQLLVESPRIQGDLQHYVSVCNLLPAQPPVFNFILRPFVAFDVENEFRGFVFQRKLTAITQYARSPFHGAIL